ncbi:ATP-dependent RNA helicase [Sphingorhabdus pulchriflava]|uniref:ATP-dependent RNA helicase n=1 Tax=Sphingorhabdus pulchriflava TaxID=2292257 RepID=A0A371BEM1_9SPHN|nr:RcnB family protein [Sphingorhabdus pulchriflava]RDV06052.1 ATP-dependent RNA helicase [Sphingorhabdus pulchriflava]
MKKIFLIGIVSTIALSPAAYAAQPAQAGAAISASGNTSNFERGEKRKGEWVRGQGAVNRDDSAGRDEQRSQRVERSPQDGQRYERREDRREERRDDRRGNWNHSQQQQPQGQQWNRGEEGRRGDDNRQRNRDDDSRRWSGRDDDNRNDGRWDRRRDYDNSRDDRRDDSRRWEGRRDDDRRSSDSRRYDRRDNDRWDRSWRSDRRYDWREHRERYRSYYRPGRYYAPNRYDRYRRFSIGIYLGSPFYSNRYWIADPWYYRLPPAHGPYRWVRYYDDVLLIDVRNGYVVDVIHDFFW